jgi:hypothetical protein
MPAECTFGCAACFQGDASAIWTARPFESRILLLDDSHFSIHIMQCRHCGQRCVKIFTEFVDWSGGDDAQYWSLIPLSPDETQHFADQGVTVNIRQLEAISAGRPILQASFPTGKDSSIRWMIGPVWIVPGR